MHVSAGMLQVLLDADLYEAGWNGLEIQPPGSSVQQHAMSSLSVSLLKKFHNDVTDDARNLAALTLFLECNERCRSFGIIEPQTLQQELILGELKSALYDFFNPEVRYRKVKECKDFSLVEKTEPFLLNLTAISRCFGLGPGSNRSAKETDLYSKLSLSTLAHTDQSLPILYRHAISEQKLWSSVEDWRSKNFPTKMVSGNSLSFVAKSRKISRTICTEPVLNMLFQKGIGCVMESRLREVYAIDLADQQFRNRRLAQLGSVTGKFGTIDLSSASDTISLSLLRQILPPEPLNWLMRTRSPSTVLPDGREIELHMISSMGNGFTFPLQTLIFSALVSAVYKVAGIPLYRNKPERDGNFAVNGDDIIVDSRVYNTLIDMLSLLGFVPNRDKSFNEGFFRESCGQDFYSGRDIRGVYVKTLLGAQDSYSAINRLIRWSTRHGVLLRRAVGYLRSGCRFIGVPYDEADDAGIKIPLSLLRTRRRDSNGAIRYLAYRSIPRRVCLPPSDAARVDPKKLLPNWKYSPDGLLQAVVAGYVRSGSITLRSNRKRAVLRNFVCPGWDERIAAAGENLRFAEEWKFFCEANLSVS